MHCCTTIAWNLIVRRLVLNRVPKQYGTNIVGYLAHNAYVAFDTRLLKFRVQFCRFWCGMSILPILDLYGLKSSHNIPNSLHPTSGVSVIYICMLIIAYMGQCCIVLTESANFCQVLVTCVTHQHENTFHSPCLLFEFAQSKLILPLHNKCMFVGNFEMAKFVE